MSVKKKLYLSNNKFIGGVVAGCAEYFDHDPTVWRLGSVVFIVLTGLMPGALLYLLAWLVMPQKRIEATEVEYTVLD